MPDDDGYPTDEELKEVEAFDIVEKGGRAFMALVHSLWHYPDWGWDEDDHTDELFNKPVRRYRISTGGWSGNESLISAMQDNYMFWGLFWESSRRGGHYVFYVQEFPTREAIPHR